MLVFSINVQCFRSWNKWILVDKIDVFSLHLFFASPDILRGYFVERLGESRPITQAINEREEQTQQHGTLKLFAPASIF